MEEKNPETKKREKGRLSGALAEGVLELLVELVFMVVALFFGFLILSVYPKEKLANVDGELVMLIGMIGLIVPIGLIILACYLIKKKRGRKMVKSVYKTLKGKYDLKTVTLTRKLHEEYTDVYVLKGKSENGSFELYRDGLDLVFAPMGERESRLNTVEDAISEIEKFMERM